MFQAYFYYQNSGVFKEDNLVMLFTTIIVMGSYLVTSDQPLSS